MIKVWGSVAISDPLNVVEQKKRQNAPFSFIAFKTFPASQNIVLKRVILHA